MIISTLGLPGSGKTTASKYIANRLGMAYVCAGDISRALAETDPDVAHELAHGRITPRAKMREAMLDSLRPQTVLDGYPRYWEQLADLYYAARPHMDCLISVVFLCDPANAIERLRKRGRDDDSDNNIFQRIENYRQQTLPVVNYLATNKMDHTIFVPEQTCAHDAAEFAIKFIKDNWL